MEPDVRRREVYLMPGRLHVSSEPCAVTTVLGSCVAVCLTDLDRRIGGMNHYALPCRLAGEDTLRCGAFALERLLEALLGLGSRARSLTAKVFGGARISSHGGKRASQLGAQNVALAREFLGAAGIPIVAEEVGGFRARKLIYFTDDGTAWIRRL